MEPGASRVIKVLLWALVVILLMAAKTLGPTEPEQVSPLRSRQFQPRTKGPVLFRHQPHEAAGVNCAACHHDYVHGRNVWRPGLPVQKCEECHPARPQAEVLELEKFFSSSMQGLPS